MEVFNYKIAARPERRRQFENVLTSQIEVALNILTACLKISELKEQVLEAFASWLRLRHGIPGSVLACHPLVYTALSSLSSETLSEAVVNVIVLQVMSLKEQLRDSSKDEEDVKAIARLFADMGDSYVELIATGSDESIMIVNALLEVASHPEYDIASMTFNFWHSLQHILTKRDPYTSFGNEVSNEGERSRRLQVFRSAYEFLVSLVSFRVKYPQDYQTLSVEDLKEFKQTRYAVADVLIDSASVLGGDATLRILYVKLYEFQSGKVVYVSDNYNAFVDIACLTKPCPALENGHNQWHPAEAALFCIRAISNNVSTVEAEVMPKIMSLLLELPHEPQLLQTVIKVLLIGMDKSEDSAAAAAEGSFKVSVEDSLHMIEAFSMVITELTADQAKQVLEKLCLSVVTPLKEIISHGPELLEKKPARELTVHIDRLAYIFRYVNQPKAVADAIQRLWPVLKAIFDSCMGNMRTMESLYQACKYVVRTSRRFMGITIGATLEEIQGLFQQHHQPFFLYLASEVIKVFGSDPSCAYYLNNLIEALFKEASISILTFLSDIFDLAQSTVGEQYLTIRESVIIPRGVTIARIFVASLTGAILSSLLEMVTYVLVALTRAYGASALEWARGSVSFIPSTAVTEVERTNFLQALNDAAFGIDINTLMAPIKELSDVCRRHRTVQEIVQGALRLLELHLVTVS
ncbi:transportin [Salix suchowensis]|nr:transportin [Salix suchowensis]